MALTGAEGQRLKEGAHINKSLLTLERVITKLSEGQAQHVPFRDSKLTRILQPALGGNARTTIVCTITPASCFAEESLTTLKFANSAKNIRTKPKVNEVLDDKALLKRYQKQIAQMEQELEKYKTQSAQGEGAPGQILAAVASPTAPGVAVGLSPIQINAERMQHRQELLELLNGGIINAKKLKKNRSDGGLLGSSRNSRRQTWCPPGRTIAAASLLDGSFVASDDFEAEAVELDEDSLEEALLNPQLDLGEGGSLATTASNAQIDELKSRVSQLEAELASASQKSVASAEAAEEHAALLSKLGKSQEEVAAWKGRVSELEQDAAALRMLAENQSSPPEGSKDAAQLQERVAELEEQLKTEMEIHEEVQSQLIEEHSKREQELEEELESAAAETSRAKAKMEQVERNCTHCNRALFWWFC